MDCNDHVAVGMDARVAVGAIVAVAAPAKGADRRQLCVHDEMSAELIGATALSSNVMTKGNQGSAPTPLGTGAFS